MKEEAPIVPKIKYVLKQISKRKSETYMLEIINHSFFDFEKHFNNHHFPNAYNLKIYLTPDIYSKNYGMKKDLEEIIRKRINDSSELEVPELKLLPDYQKLELLSTEVKPIYTKWEEINTIQQKLLEILERSLDSIDYQSIGNTSRTLMDKLARAVFKTDLHKADDPTIELNNGKFKNQLNTYISFELKGKKNKVLRKVAESSMEFVSDSIDLMNSTTHKLDAERHFAELCVISAISAVSIIKIIDELE